MLTEAIGVSTLQHTTSTQTGCLQMSLQHLIGIGIGIGHWYISMKWQLCGGSHGSRRFFSLFYHKLTVL